MIAITVTTAPRATESPDDGFLEFLGSVDSEVKDWHDYLARTDIDKVARRAVPGNNLTAPAPAPATNPPTVTRPAAVDPPSDAGKTVASP